MIPQQENDYSNQWILPEEFLSTEVIYDKQIQQYQLPENYLKFFNLNVQVPHETPEEEAEKNVAIQEQVKLGIIKLMPAPQQMNSLGQPAQYHPSLNVTTTPAQVTVLNGKAVTEQPKQQVKTSPELNKILSSVFESKKSFFDNIPKVAKNDPCPCGSGKKYKKCHGK